MGRVGRFLANALVVSALSLLTTVAVAAGMGRVLFGSAYAVPAMVHGKAILVEPSEVRNAALRADRPDRFSFALLNLTSRPMKVLAVNASCTCMSATDLPLDLPPHSWRNLDIVVKPTREQTEKPYSETATLFLSVPSAPVTIRVLGVVAEPVVSP